jgi:dimethylhistidine N-methyltransferase
MNGLFVLDQYSVLSSREDNEFLRDVLEGLSRDQKAVPGKYLWDETGSAIFDAICNSEGYGLTRLEMGLLRECANEVADIVGRDACIVEFGSGASRKVRVLLDAMDRPKRYIAIDISCDFMGAAATRLRGDYPQLDVVQIRADYSEPIPALPIPRPCRVLGFFPGSTIGNMEPGLAVHLLTSMKAAVGPGWLLVGQDHNSDPKKLAAAYGGTLMASFHKNILVRMMRDLGAHIALEDFEHQVRILSCPARVEAHLVARKATAIEVASRRIQFAPGETIRTDTSWKHTPSEFQGLIAAADWTPVMSWKSWDSGYTLHLLRAT